MKKLLPVAGSVFILLSIVTLESISAAEYHYEAQRLGSKYGSQKESIEMQIRQSNDKLLYITKTTSKENIEVININMDIDGNFISGERNIYTDPQKRISVDSIWKNQNKLFVKRRSKRNSKIKEFKLPKNKKLAVDGSLLLLFRSFPFNEATTWDIFMVDFSQRSVSVTAQNVGIENIIVPAGEFNCYRMEIVVDFFIFHPKIIYWITTKRPHFLIKHVGKRGPFSKKYITRLVSIEN